MCRLANKGLSSFFFDLIPLVAQQAGTDEVVNFTIPLGSYYTCDKFIAELEDSMFVVDLTNPKFQPFVQDTNDACGLGEGMSKAMFSHFSPLQLPLSKHLLVIPEVTPKRVKIQFLLQIHSNFTLNSLVFEIHSLKSENFHSLFLESIPLQNITIKTM